MELDRTPGQVNHLSNALERLSAAVTAAFEASNRHTASLVHASSALSGGTIVLVIVTAVLVYYTAAGTVSAERGAARAA